MNLENKKIHERNQTQKPQVVGFHSYERKDNL